MRLHQCCLLHEILVIFVLWQISQFRFSKISANDKKDFIYPIPLSSTALKIVHEKNSRLHLCVQVLCQAKHFLNGLRPSGTFGSRLIPFNLWRRKFLKKNKMWRKYCMLITIVLETAFVSFRTQSVDFPLPTFSLSLVNPILFPLILEIFIKFSIEGSWTFRCNKIHLDENNFTCSKSIHEHARTLLFPHVNGTTKSCRRHKQRNTPWAFFHTKCLRTLIRTLWMVMLTMSWRTVFTM